MNLRNVKVGDQVWHAFKHRGWSERPAVVGLATITHVDKAGRLYICSEDCDGIGNWRYGFDPATGLSKYGHYDGTQLSYAPPEGIAAWTAAKESRIDAKEATRVAERRAAVFARHGEAMYVALKDGTDGSVLLAVDEDLLTEWRQWETWRSEFRKMEGSQIELTWADLPEFQLQAINQ